MKINNKYYFFSYYLPVLISLVFAFEIFPIAKVENTSSNGFSAQRVAMDIEYISKKPHSIQHPKERDVVRNYLSKRLKQMGAEPKIFEYDSIKCKFGGTFNIANVYAQFNPLGVTNATQYILLVAHLDSRFYNIVLKDTVYSYGAADDGYGLGVILESIGQAVKYRKEWKQGVKVLFTDSEEHELDGMFNAVKNNNNLFNNVNFVINVEARGVKGDALLFETSPGNSAVMNLYKHAVTPRGFSLTTLVYKAMPNDTDFTLLKDSIPGLNFAVIDNLHYYHTNLDNFSNISLESLQHYGNQIEPIIKEYLVSNKYSSPQSLKSFNDNVFFAFPLLGMFNFTHKQYSTINKIAFSAFLLLLLLYMKFSGAKFIGILKGSLYALFFGIAALIVGEIVAYLSAMYTGLSFNIVSVKYVKYDNVIAIFSIFILLGVISLFIKRKVKKQKYFALEFLLGTLLLLGVMSFGMFVTVFENFFLLIPLITSALALLLGCVNCGKFFFIISAMLITLTMGYFLHILYIAITIGALGIILMLGALYIIIVISQYYSYKVN
ncbi:MAG: M28 family peptidase [Bacteroidales bacterium]